MKFLHRPERIGVPDEGLAAALNARIPALGGRSHNLASFISGVR
jgi:hypothetical protein